MPTRRSEANVRAVLDSPYTRMPIWRGSTDNIIGIVHAKDVLRALADAASEPQRIDVVKIAQKPWFVPDTTSVPDQLNAFLRRKAHIAIVVDEYGEVEGLVTLEDILEEIVGDIADEHDTEVQGVRQEADGSVVVDGWVPIRDLNRALDWSLPDDEATTVAGLVIHESQTIPEEKQAFTFHGKRFIVMKRDRNRITRLRIRPADKCKQAAAGIQPNSGIRQGQAAPAGLPAGGFARGCCLHGHGVQPAVELVLEQFIDRPVAIDPLDMPAKASATMRMRKWVSPVPSKGVVMIAACVMMAGVQMAFVDHQKTLGGEAFVQRCFNAALP
jgi:Mg2+/Co2+ transporter CorC